jgi:hypothetical protein
MEGAMRDHEFELHSQVLRFTPRCAHGTLVEIEAMEGVGDGGGTYAILKIQNERGDHRVAISKSECALLGNFLARYARMKDHEF